LREERGGRGEESGGRSQEGGEANNTSEQDACTTNH